MKKISMKNRHNGPAYSAGTAPFPFVCNLLQQLACEGSEPSGLTRECEQLHAAVFGRFRYPSFPFRYSNDRHHNVGPQSQTEKYPAYQADDR